MNYSRARTLLAGAINDMLGDAPVPAKDVHWDNTSSVDLDNAGDIVLNIRTYWDGAAQIDLGKRPLHRVAGTVWFIILSREGTGTSNALILADMLTDRLSFLNLEGLVTRVPSPGRQESHDGWRSQEWRLPFFFDSTA
jgi:hypothetical protein